MPDDFPQDFPSGSCLIVDLRPDIQCEDENSCFNPSTALMYMRNPQMNNKEIQFSLAVPKDSKAGGYSLSFTFNYGWCGENDPQFIKSGDYKNVNSLVYYLGLTKVDRVVAFMEKYSGDPSTPDPGSLGKFGIHF